MSIMPSRPMLSTPACSRDRLPERREQQGHAGQDPARDERGQEVLGEEVAHSGAPSRHVAAATPLAGSSGRGRGAARGSSVTTMNSRIRPTSRRGNSLERSACCVA